MSRRKPSKTDLLTRKLVAVMMGSKLPRARVMQAAERAQLAFYLRKGMRNLEGPTSDNLMKER